MEKKPPLIWLNAALFSLSFLLAVVVTPIYAWKFDLSAAHWVWLFISFSFCNLSITMGYHRLWSHKAFEAHWLVRLLCALGGAFALQNSALHWASDHRVHHKFVDQNDKDPYSAKHGFWFSHIGWMLRSYNQETYHDYANCRDLQKDPIVMWQHRHYLLIAVTMNLAIPLILGVIYNDIWGMLLVIGAVRLVLSHHTTFFINSLAHLWGSQPYSNKNTARDNGLLAIFTFGEGYHNYHHIFENDYRNGIRWWQYDPTKWLIKACSWIGLTSKLRKAPALKIEMARAKMGLMYVQHKISALPNHQALMVTFQQEFDGFMSELQNYYDVKKQLIESKKDQAVKTYECSILKVRYEQVKLSFFEKRTRWNRIVSQYA